MKRRKMVALALIFAMAFTLMAGCTSKVNTAAKTNDQTKKQGNVRTDLVIAKMADVVSLDPQEQNDTASSAAIRMIYDSLLTRDAVTGEILPALAENYEVVDDVTYRFTIRQGVKFHNGYDFTVEDVKFTIEKAMQAARVKVLVETISEVNIIDDKTVEIKTAYPYAPLIGNLTNDRVAMLSKKHFEKCIESDYEYKDSPIGTGPMVYKSWTPNDNLVVVKNENYWGKEAVATSVTFKVIPEESSRTIALQTGEVDMVDAVPPIDIDRILADDNFVCTTQVSPSITYVSYNMKKKPFDDVRIRQAMSYLVDKQEIIDVVCEGKGVEINTVCSELADFCDTELKLYERDVEKAKYLMKDAGYPNGFSTSIALNSDERSRVAQCLQSQFAPAGIELDINLMEWGAYLEHISHDTHDMFILGWSTFYDLDSSMNSLFHTDSGGPTGNRAWYSSEKADGLIEKGRSTINPKDREPIYKELQRVLMEDCVFIPIYSKDTVVALNKNLKDIQVSPVDTHVYVYGYVEE